VAARHRDFAPARGKITRTSQSSANLHVFHAFGHQGIADVTGGGHCQSFKILFFFLLSFAVGPNPWIT
jgi:hypothetical protein